MKNRWSCIKKWNHISRI